MKRIVIVAEIDTAAIAEARNRVPSLEHDQAYASPLITGSLTDAAE